MSGAMNQRIPLGRWVGLPLTISPLGIVCYLAVIPLSALGSSLLANLDLVSSLWVGCLVAFSMFIFEWLHQWGHAVAARRTGYPMIGIHFFSLFSASQYPPDEPPLPPILHIRRALGGFWINLLIGLLLGAAALNLWSGGGALGWFTAVNAVWNFFILGLGALVPINMPGVLINDGASLLHYWRLLQTEQVKQ